MPINPLIALGGQSVDLATPLNNLVKMQQVKRENELRDKQIDLLDRRVTMEQAEAEAKQSESMQKNALLGASAMANLLDRNDIEGADAFLRSQGQFFVAPGQNPGETIEGIREMIRTRPDEAKAIARSAREMAIAKGYIKNEGFTLGNTRYDAAGNVIASNEKPSAPVVRDFAVGDKTVTKQWDEKTGEWVTQSEGMRFAPQAADNALVEIGDPSSPTGTRFVPRAQAINQPGKPPSGMNVEVGPDGTVRMTQGRGGAGGITNSTRTNVEKAAIDTGNMLSQVRTFADQFKPEFFTYGGRLDRKVKGVRASIDPTSLTPEERKKYEEATRYASDLGRVQAQQINELYGAALSAGENERAKAFIVNPEDDPVTAEQKIQSYEKYLRRTQAKLAYITKNGLSVEGVSVDDMPDIMNKRAKEIEAEMAGRVPEKELRGVVSRRLAEEFGLLQ